MAGAHCSVCGREEFLPFRCKLCAQPHCLDHRLPENHRCQGLGDYRARVRDERVLGLPREPDMPMRVRGPSPLARATGALSWFRRSTTHKLLGLILLAYLVQVGGGVAFGLASGIGPLGGYAFVTEQLAVGDGGPFRVETLAAKPWSPLTSVFAHATPLHLFFNAIVLYFFGISLEQRIGGRKLLALFLVSGVAAGVAQAAIFGGAVVGASGGLMGVLGTLTILAPTMQVLLIFIPIPLWALTVFFALADMTGIFSGTQGGIANLAHLIGLALGLGYGARLRRRGVMPRVRDSWASQRRW